MRSPGIIDNPEKIGIGAVSMFGYAKMLEDMQMFNPAWFYTWEARLPANVVDHWSLGNDVRLGGPAFDRHLVINGSSDGWTSHVVSVTPGANYDLSIVVEGTPEASGGVKVTFLSSTGSALSSRWLPLGETSGSIQLSNLAAPAMATQAKIIIWNNFGTLQIDDVQLSSKEVNAVKNGSFQPASSAKIDHWVQGKEITSGGNELDKHVILNGSSDGWVYQDVSITSGGKYALSMNAGGNEKSTGGVQVSFMNDAGTSLAKQWVPLDATSGTVTLDHLAAPSEATQARILAWGKTGALEIDDVVLSQKGPDTILNGGFETLARGRVDKWVVGKDVSFGGTGDDRHMVLKDSTNSWFYQDLKVKPGEIYSMSLDAGGNNSATGGIMVRFLSKDGKVLTQSWRPLDESSGTVTLGDLVAPVGAIKARVLAWGEDGALEIDDVTFTPQGPNLLRNGAFQDVTLAKEVVPDKGFVPMIWGASNVNPVELDAIKGAPVILGFNEPDESSQSAMSVKKAISLWPELMETGARLGSPATTISGTLGENSWLGQFMAQADAADLRVDFVAVHYYTTNKDVKAFENFLNKTYEAYEKPIWVTEWALADWRKPGRFTQEENAKFMTEAVQMMDDLVFVEKHAWFGIYDGMDGWHLNSHLIDNSGGLTPVGQAFADLTSGHADQIPALADELSRTLVDDFIF